MCTFGGEETQIDLLTVQNGVYSVRKVFAHLWSIFLPFRVDPFSEGLGVQESKQEVTQVVSLLKKWWKIYKGIRSPGHAHVLYMR